MKTFHSFLRLQLLVLVSIAAAQQQTSSSLVRQDEPPQAPSSVAGDVAVGAPYDWKHPEYPKEALRKKLQGSVLLRLSLDEKGRVIDVSVINGDQDFIEAAIRSVRKWKYSPYFVNDVSTKVATLVTIDFRIDKYGKPDISARYKEWLPQNVFRVGGGVSAPRAIRTQDPQYSEEARQDKYQGTCVLGVVVGPDGRPHNVRVVRPLGKGLDEKAIEAVQKWQFEPARKNGQPVAVLINVEVQFRLY
jgi:TonB family protein